MNKIRVFLFALVYIIQYELRLVKSQLFDDPKLNTGNPFQSLMNSANTSIKIKQKEPITSKYKLSSIYSESAIIDQETGQVYWQNGKPRLSDTWSLKGFEKKKQNDNSMQHTTNLRHAKPLLLSFVLWISILNKIKIYFQSNPLFTFQQVEHQIQILKRQYPMTQKILSFIIHIIHFLFRNILFFIGNPFTPWFVWMCALFYILEAYTCSTRKYLSNALSSTDELEQYLQTLRHAKPIVTWKLRCFHYQHEKSIKDDDNDDDEQQQQQQQQQTSNILPKMPKKIITHRATKQYQFDDWNDQTMVSLWNRAQVTYSSAVSSTSTIKPMTHSSNDDQSDEHSEKYIEASSNNNDNNHNNNIVDGSSMIAAAPYSKISFSKFLVLGNAKAREDYFQQQREFVKNEAFKDDYTEFFTDIQVDGFKSKILVHRQNDAILNHFHFHLPFSHVENKKKKNYTSANNTKKYKKIQLYQFWIYTLFGLTVPFRFWLDKHCDTLCVTLVKETTYSPNKKKKKKKVNSDKKESYWNSLFPLTTDKNTTLEMNHTVTDSVNKTIVTENIISKNMRKLDFYWKKSDTNQVDNTLHDDDIQNDQRNNTNGLDNNDMGNNHMNNENVNALNETDSN